MPFYAVQILYHLNNTDIPISKNNREAGITGVPRLIDTGVVIVDKTNYHYDTDINPDMNMKAKQIVQKEIQRMMDPSLR